MVRAGERHHRVTVRVGRHAAAMFVRRAARGNEMDFVKVKAAFRSARDRQVADVDGIKRATEQRNPALARLTPGSAVTLRRGAAQRRPLPRPGGLGLDPTESLFPPPPPPPPSPPPPSGPRPSA